MQVSDKFWAPEDIKPGEFVKCHNQKDLAATQKKFWDAGIVTSVPINCFGEPGFWLKVETKYVLSDRMIKEED